LDLRKPTGYRGCKYIRGNLEPGKRMVPKSIEKRFFNGRKAKKKGNSGFRFGKRPFLLGEQKWFLQNYYNRKKNRGQALSRTPRIIH